MEYYAVVKSGESLSHHGIKGMKWGVRRFQNPDGSLTPAGRRRYGVGLQKYLSTHKHQSGHTDDETKSNPLIQAIYTDKRIKEAKDRLDSTAYDGPDEDYDPWTDKRAISKAKKDFKRDMGADFDPDNRQHEKIFDYYLDSAAEELGLYEKAKKKNSAKNWDKAYDEYVKAVNDTIRDYLGSMSDKKIGDWHSSDSTYSQIVRDIIDDMQNDEWLAKYKR